MRPARRDLLTLLAGGMLMAGCKPAGNATPLPKPKSDRPLVIASMSVLADVAQAIGGDDLGVRSIIGPDQSAHHHDPSPKDLVGFERASLVIHVGFKLEGWVARLPESTGYRGPIVQASESIAPILVQGTIPDPHTWQSFDGLLRYARTISKSYGEIWPHQAEAFRGRFVDFVQQLAAAREAASSALATLSSQKTLLVVPHNSFRYLGRELSLEFLAVSDLAGGTQPSAQTLAGLIDQIRQADAAACFIEGPGDERLMGEIARESGARLGGRLYADALSGPDGPAATSIAMLTHNVTTIADALRG